MLGNLGSVGIPAGSLGVSFAWNSLFTKHPGRESWSELCLDFLVRKWFSSGNMVPRAFGLKFQVFLYDKMAADPSKFLTIPKKFARLFWVRPTKVLDLFPRSSSDFFWVRPTSAWGCNTPQTPQNGKRVCFTSYSDGGACGGVRGLFDGTACATTLLSIACR